MQISGWGAPAVARCLRARQGAVSKARSHAARLSCALEPVDLLHRTRAGSMPRVASPIACSSWRISPASPRSSCRLTTHNGARRSSWAISARTETHAREGIGLCQLDRCDPDTLAYGSHDTGVCARAHCARALALRGRPDAALAMMNEAVARARDSRSSVHPCLRAGACGRRASVPPRGERDARIRGGRARDRQRAQLSLVADVEQLPAWMVAGRARRGERWPVGAS